MFKFAMLLPFATKIPSFFPVEQLSHEVKTIGESRFLSVTTEIGYSDPLAILEAIHQNNEAVCYLKTSQ